MFWIAVFCLTPIVVLSAVSMMALSYPLLLSPKSKSSGEWVAEVWLEWEIVRGSTMYRQRFRTKFGAWLFSKIYALFLDAYLPTGYWETTRGGTPYVEKYEFGIFYGIRKMYLGESTKFRKVFSPFMPGDKRSTSEHYSAHPMNFQE